MTIVRIKNVFDSPRKSPINIPLFVFLAFLPASFFKVLNDCRFIKVCVVTELLNIVNSLHLYVF
jgi:hypothetical protein